MIWNLSAAHTIQAPSFSATDHLSLRLEEMLFRRGIVVSNETVRR
jgi:transposase-like protein